VHIHHVVAVGASAGGVEVLAKLFALLPAGLDAPILVVQHLSPNYVSELPKILNQHTPIPAVFAEDGSMLENGKIYVAPPDHHLLVKDRQISVTRGPKENRFRPSVDALFRSVAYTYREKAIGIILSGALDDGTAGLWSIKHFRGITVIQEPAEAQFDSMPLSARDQVDIDYCLPVREISQLLIRITKEPVMEEPNGQDRAKKRMEMEVSIAVEGDAFRKGIMEEAELTPFTCPECHGVLVQIREGKIVRYRCHTGHAYSRSALLAAITEKVDESYWGAMKSLKEAAMLLNHMGKELENQGQTQAAALFFEEEKASNEQSHQLRHALLNRRRFSAESLINQAKEK
jgi:two-component system, chemotaxis family, protein-glutamate methylesterase/glutaminase